MVTANRHAGGLFHADDLADYDAVWREPVDIGYRGFQIYTTPPNSAGFQILNTLKLLDGSDELAFQEPRSLHLTIEAVKLATADRIAYAGDPDFVEIPLERLLSQEYAARQRKRVREDSSTALSSSESRLPWDKASTTHFAVADRDCNVVTITQTLGNGFGSGVVIGDTGVFLNNMCKWFSLDEGSPNLIGPAKRVDFVLAPTQTLKDGRIHLSIGTPGSGGILQTTPQVLMHLLEYGLNVQESIEAPRFTCDQRLSVGLENRFPREVLRQLALRGHQVRLVDPWSRGGFGGFQGIRVDHGEGVFQGGADPRRDGLAAGW